MDFSLTKNNTFRNRKVFVSYSSGNKNLFYLKAFVLLPQKCIFCLFLLKFFRPYSFFNWNFFSLISLLSPIETKCKDPNSHSPRLGAKICHSNYDKIGLKATQYCLFMKYTWHFCRKILWNIYHSFHFLCVGELRLPHLNVHMRNKL